MGDTVGGSVWRPVDIYRQPVVQKAYVGTAAFNRGRNGPESLRKIIWGVLAETYGLPVRVIHNLLPIHSRKAWRALFPYALTLILFLFESTTVELLGTVNVNATLFYIAVGTVVGVWLSLYGASSGVRHRLKFR